MDLKKLLIIAGLIAVIVFGVQYFKKTDQRAFHVNSKDRVQKLFDNMKSGRTADQQDAMGYWRVGHPETASSEKITAFERFLEKKDLPMQISSYEYVSSELVNGNDVVNRYVLLTCEVDGRELSMIIRHKMPIEWAS
jgi:FtsZ-interacting cell division protein ZipA